MCKHCDKVRPFSKADQFIVFLKLGHINRLCRQPWLRPRTPRTSLSRWRHLWQLTCPMSLSNFLRRLSSIIPSSVITGCYHFQFVSSFIKIQRNILGKLWQLSTVLCLQSTVYAMYFALRSTLLLLFSTVIIN